MAAAKKPVPVPSVESRPYWEALKQHRLVMPRCASCGRFWFPPSLLCPHCNARDFAWAEISGRGKVFTFVVFHRVYHPGFADEVPYVVALIELAEGPRMISNVIGVPLDKVVCEMPVRVVFEDREGATVPLFTPAAL
jgi:uncharacterized OB-fold protein